MAGDFPTRVEAQRGPGLPGAAGQGLAARTCLTPPARSRVTGDTGAAPAPGIWHLPGDGDRTSTLEWGLLPNCSSHRRWTHPPGHGEDTRYCGQNEGFLAVVPAVGGLDGLDAMLLAFFFFLQRCSFCWRWSFWTKGTRAISLLPTKRPWWLWLLHCPARQCSLPSTCDPLLTMLLW